LEARLAEAEAAIRRGRTAGRGNHGAVPAGVSHQLDFAYGSAKYERPFFVRAMWHDGQFTYVKSDARELPALYEVKDGKPAVVNFQVREGTFVVPKVLDRGYLALGDQRFSFSLQDGDRRWPTSPTRPERRRSPIAGGPSRRAARTCRRG
jgi:hypothetical protein